MSDATTDFSPAPVAAPPVRLDDQGRLAEDVFCHNCDYNLRGLPRDGRCPECGEAIEPSLAPTCLRYSEPRWLRKLVAGAVLVLASAVVDTVLIVVRVYFLRFWSPAQFPLYCAQLAASLVAFLGFWKVTAPEPGDTETSGFTARYVLRMFAVLAVSLRLSTLILVVDVGAGPPAAAWAIGIVGVTVARFVAGCVFARQIALRVPNEPIARRFGTLIGVFLVPFPLEEYRGFRRRLFGAGDGGAMVGWKSSGVGCATQGNAEWPAVVLRACDGRCCPA